MHDSLGLHRIENPSSTEARDFVTALCNANFCICDRFQTQSVACLKDRVKERSDCFVRRLQCPCTSTLLRSGSAWFFHPPAEHQSKTLRFQTSGVQELISAETLETVQMSLQVRHKVVLIEDCSNGQHL